MLTQQRDQPCIIKMIPRSTNARKALKDVLGQNHGNRDTNLSQPTSDSTFSESYLSSSSAEPALPGYLVGQALWGTQGPSYRLSSLAVPGVSPCSDVPVSVLRPKSPLLKHTPPSLKPTKGLLLEGRVVMVRTSF